LTESVLPLNHEAGAINPTAAASFENSEFRFESKVVGSSNSTTWWNEKEQVLV